VLGQALGLTDAEFDALQEGYAASPLFDAREKATLAWAEAMTLNTAKRDGPAWDDMRRLFSDAEIVEISMACALFNMINRLNDSFRTELEPEEYNRRQHGAVGVTPAALNDYACRICAAGRPGA
jgi:alkylhydroperoxidase family enzyme